MKKKLMIVALGLGCVVIVLFLLLRTDKDKGTMPRAYTGSGWAQFRQKVNFKDSVNFTKTPTGIAGLSPYSLADSLKYFYTTFNVMKYGAKADGTDDQPEIQAAVDAATAAGGGIVYLPEGTYYTSTEIIIKSNVTIKGAGQGVTIIKIRSNWDVSSSKAIIREDAGSVNTEVSDLTLHGNKSAFVPKNRAFAIADNVATHSDNFRVRNVEVRNISYHGFYFPGTDNVLLENVYFHNVGDTLHAAGVYFSGASYVKMVHCELDTIFEHCIYLNAGNDFLFDANRFNNAGYGNTLGYGVSLRADSNLVFTNNIVTHNNEGGINLTYTPSKYVISNNIVRDNYGAKEVFFAGTGDDIIFSGNLIETHITTATHDGIYVDGDYTNLKIISNHIFSPVGILVATDSVTNLVIDKNFISRRNSTFERGRLEYGIRLYTASTKSGHVYVIDNIIDSSEVAINLAAGWYARNTVIKNNTSVDALTADIQNSSTIVYDYDLGSTYSPWDNLWLDGNLSVGGNIPSPNITGVATIAALKIGPATAAEIDSVMLVNNQLAFYVGVDTTANYVPYADRQDISTITTIPTIYTAAGDTSNYPTPGKAGNIFINTSANKVYVSKSGARGSWLILN